MENEILIVKSKKWPQQRFYELTTFEVVTLNVGTPLLNIGKKELTKFDFKKTNNSRQAASKISMLKSYSRFAIENELKRDYSNKKIHKQNVSILMSLIDEEWETKKSISGYVFFDPKTFKKYWVSHYDLEYYKTLEINI